MANLISPGVSVPVTDQSFYIPQLATTVPLIFGATQANKLQPDGVSTADGTNENSIVRTITSIGQSVQLYGVPYFWSDNSGTNGTTLQYHGDARNEYGLFALNQYLGIGNQAYFIRANIDLSDSAVSFYSVGTPVIPGNAPISAVGVGTGTISGPLGTGVPVVPSPFKQPETFTIVCIGPQVGSTVNSFTVTGSLSGMVGIATVGVPFGVSGSTVTNESINFLINDGILQLNGLEFNVGDYFEFTSIYQATANIANVGNGTVSGLTPETGASALPNPTTGGQPSATFTIDFTSATAYTVSWVNAGGASTISSTPGVVGTAWQDVTNLVTFIVNQGSTLFHVGDTFTFSLIQTLEENPLGSNDAQRRMAIITALQAEITSNQDVLSEAYEYNLILCPGYYEVVQYLVELANNVNDEAFVIGDSPVTYTPEQTANWANAGASSNNLTPRVHSSNLSYYYPWGYGSNLDGNDVVVAASGIALRTYAYSDNVSYVWYAPAGATRGVVDSVTAVGYVSGTLGQASTFNPVNLNQGQRDSLYQYNTNINPIAFFTGYGLLVWGQKTSQGAASALDRVNVSRLLCYLRRTFRKGAFPFVFEINDTITQRNLKTLLDGELGEIMTLRGLYDYVTICDSSNNTPVRIDSNMLWADVGIKPAKVAEFIYIPITIYTTGATMG
jgi:hypothetical protein